MYVLTGVLICAMGTMLGSVVVDVWYTTVVVLAAYFFRFLTLVS